ncbi:MAG TPA: glycosyltransferase family 2 protein, partial [Spirochaetota bacterium]|nr:glycosyltransferase family 2 protein [Spirochaetota bacterium]
MTKNELVSVIVPVYNRADTIVRAIDSVINQTYKNVEIIIIDDGSSDNLKSILDEIKYNNIHYYYQENSGASSARNHGLLKARGKYCIYLDSDDELLPDCIESLVDLSINHNLNYITYNAELVYKQKKIVKKYDKSFFITQENVALDQIPLKGSQLFFKLDNNSKEFLFDTNLSVCEDIDIMLRILQKNKIFFYNKVLLKMYRFGTNNRLS